MSDSLQPHELQHARLPCPSLSLWICSNSCPLSQRCYPSILSVALFSSCSQSFPSGSIPVSQLLVSRGQSIGAMFPHILLKQNNKILTEAPRSSLSLSLSPLSLTLSLCSENIHLVWSITVLDHFEITYLHAQL